MILTFQGKGLAELYKRQREMAQEAPTEWIRAKSARVLARLDIAREPEHMDLPGWSLSPLGGQTPHSWRVWVTGDLWIVFRFIGHGNEVAVADVDLVDVRRREKGD